MTNVTESLVDLVEKVSLQPGTIQDYAKLDILLRNLSQDGLEEAVSSHKVIDIFAHMDLSRNEISELALSMASIIFSTFHLTEFIHSHESELYLAISSKNYELRDFIISRLKEGIEHSKPTNVDIPEKIIIGVINIAIQDTIEQAASALHFVKSFALCHPKGIEIITNSQPLKECYSSHNEEQIIRVSELFIEIASKVPSKLSIMDQSKCFDGLIGAFKADDPLLQMNCIAILKMFASFIEGRDYLQLKGIIDILLQNLTNIHQNSLRSLLLPGYLSFFAEIAASEPAKYLGESDQPNSFVKAIADSVKDDSPTTFLAALELIAFICRNTEGKMAIAPHLASSAALGDVLLQLGRLINNAPSEFQTRVIYILADVLRVSQGLDVSISDVLPVVQTTWLWLGRIAGAPSDVHGTINVYGLRILNRIWQLAKQPFQEGRLAAFHLLEAISTEPWGVTLFLEQPGFMEYLLNRGTEEGLAADNPSLQPAKFAIIVQCYQTNERWTNVCPQWRTMNEEQVKRVEAHIKDGIWGSKKAEVSVAMESGS